ATRGLVLLHPHDGGDGHGARVLVVARQEVRRKQAADHEQQEKQEPRPDLGNRRPPWWHVALLLDDGRAGRFLVDPPCGARRSLRSARLTESRLPLRLRWNRCRSRTLRLPRRRASRSPFGSRTVISSRRAKPTTPTRRRPWLSPSSPTSRADPASGRSSAAG